MAEISELELTRRAEREAAVILALRAVSDLMKEEIESSEALRGHQRFVKAVSDQEGVLRPHMELVDGALHLHAGAIGRN